MSMLAKVCGAFAIGGMLVMAQMALQHGNTPSGYYDAFLVSVLCAQLAGF